MPRKKTSINKKIPITMQAALVAGAFTIVAAIIGGVITRSPGDVDTKNVLQTTTQETVFPTQIANTDTPIQPAITLEFQPVINNGLSPDAHIIRLLSLEDNYLYMLNYYDGSVIGAYKTLDGNDFNVDDNFNCKPGSYAGYQVGPLVDILAMPKVNAFNSTVLGIDAAGNVLYCAPGQVSRALTLPDLPNTNWGHITALVLDNGNLYVLDATSRSVWVFVGKDGTFVDTPYFYFSNQIPNIDNAIDLAVSGNDLYLLHADGHLTFCTYSLISGTPTACVDPYPYVETRLGKDTKILNSYKFSKIFVSQSPNHYVALLEPYTHSIYIFTPRSLALTYVIEQPIEDIALTPELASTFTLGSDNTAYFAIGSQIYTASLPER